MAKNHQFIHKKKVETSWDQLALAADGDFVSVILLSIAGKTESTAMWLSAHSVEKYLKAWMLKHDPEFKLSKNGHNLEALWKEARTRFPDSVVFQEPPLEDFIRELNLDNDIISLRYSYVLTIENPIFTRMYALVSCLLREEILGLQEYVDRGEYGMTDFSFGFNTHFFENPRIDGKHLVSSEIDKLLDFPLARSVYGQRN